MKISREFLSTQPISAIAAKNPYMAYECNN